MTNTNNGTTNLSPHHTEKLIAYLRWNGKTGTAKQIARIARTYPETHQGVIALHRYLNDRGIVVTVGGESACGRACLNRASDRLVRDAARILYDEGADARERRAALSDAIVILRSLALDLQHEVDDAHERSDLPQDASDWCL